MNADDKNIEPVADPGLSFGYSNQCTQRRVKNDSGAGANAGSCVDMTFVTTNALSELVWSPQKGLCLKCADGSFSKNPSLLWGAGPTELNLDVAKNDPTSEEPIVRIRDVGDGVHTLQTEIVLASQVCSVKECESCEIKMQAPSSGRENFESPSCMEKERENKDETGPYICPLEKLESAAENSIKTPRCENVCDVATKIVGSASAQVQTSSQQGDGRLSRDDNRGIKQSPTYSRTQRYQMKGKAKALSYGDLDEKVLDMDDDSHESVESCNSAGLFSTGKKRRNFDSQLHAGSKSVKTKIQESPGSSSFVKQDSSFMNMISNMTKGFLRSKEDEAPSHALTLANHNHGHENRDKNLVSCNINQDKVCKTMGFHSYFQSLYCPQPKTQARESKELELDNKICYTNATPLSCRMVTGNVCRQFLPSNDKLNESTSGHGTAPATLAKLFSTSTASAQEIKRNNSAENKSSCNLATDMERNGTSSNSSLCKRKRSSAENMDTELPSEGQAVSNSRYKSDPLRSSWISRFTPKTSGPLSNQGIGNRSAGDAFDSSGDSPRLNAEWQNHHKTVMAREEEHSNKDLVDVQNCTTSTEVSFGINKANGQDDEKSMCKLNSILPFSRFRNSEAMAPVFARRLDALKHIMHADDSAHGNLACFFCGIKGHHVRGCPEITGSELEGLLRNVNSYNGVKELPCVCTRCFQSNHWAFACPNASSSTRHQPEYGASLVHECSPGKTLLDRRNEDDSKQSDGKYGQLPTADAPTVCNERLNEAFTCGKMNLNMKLFGKDIVSSSGEKKLKENQAMPSSNFVGSQISDGPMGIFDAVKMLRLSRAVFVKLMNSHTPPSRLDGFFLRLRLGKWEQGPGGSGYGVACITGAENESSTRNSKNSIAVNVGGVKCLVESQYISNHDFTKDELMAWWRATLKGGGNIPSEEGLRLKVKEMKMLGV
uniref:Plus3 domain-containing protein n=1 Tax=Salix viminalis TaxID=40686 RepID=A0A6N2N3B3_SALVM